MLPRGLFLFLVTTLGVLIVTFAVLMGFQALFAALGDAAASRVLLWLAVAALLGLVIDATLLVIALGLNAARPPDDPSRPD